MIMSGKGFAGEHHNCCDKNDDVDDDDDYVDYDVDDDDDNDDDDDDDDDDGDINQQTGSAIIIIIIISPKSNKSRNFFSNWCNLQVTSRNTNKSKSGSEILYHVKIRQSASFLFTCELKIGH